MKIKLGLGKIDMNNVTLYCGGELYDFTKNLGCSFEYVCTDSREADPSTMFIATRGERVDGHDYITSAIEQGCRCVLCEYVPQNIKGKKVAFSVVENSFEAFSKLAKGYRSKQPLKSIAITGSVGKTTTKELVATVIKEKYNLYSTVGNFNSIIGMPMSLMEAQESSELAVFEMGMSHFGEILSMTNTCNPYIAMITNIGTSHLEYLRTRENIAKAKFEITNGLCDNGILILNADEPLLCGHHSDRYKTLYVSPSGENDAHYRAQNIVIKNGESSFDFVGKDINIKDIKIPAVGKHFVENAMFAVLVGLINELEPAQIKAGLAKYRACGMRQHIYTKNDILIIDDCYNAAPKSMRAGIEVLENLGEHTRKIAVLGDMRELGKDTEKFHKDIGKYLIGRADYLFTVGELGHSIAQGAIEHGMDPQNVFINNDCENIQSTVSQLKTILKANDTILFKASRGVGLERIIKSVFS